MLATKNLFHVLLRLDVQSYTTDSPSNSRGVDVCWVGVQHCLGLSRMNPDEHVETGTSSMGQLKSMLLKTAFQKTASKSIWMIYKMFTTAFSVKPIAEIQRLVFPISPLNNSHTPPREWWHWKSTKPTTGKSKTKAKCKQRPPIPQSSVLRTHLTCVTSPTDSCKTISMLQIKHRHRCCSWKCLFVEQIIYNRKWHLCQFKKSYICTRRG